MQIPGTNLDDCVYRSEDVTVSDPDPVNHPSHYTRGKIEVADFIEDQGLDTKAWLAMAIKYICRAGYKDPYKYYEDLEKAVWYLNREISKRDKIKND